LILGYSKDQWEHKGGFESYYTDADNADDGANRYTINAGSTYDYTETSFLRAATRFENDLYGTYRKQWVLMSGLGFYLHNTDTAKLSVSLGPGYRISERQPTDSEFPSLRNYEVIATSTLDGSVSFSETFSVGAVMDVAHGEENTHYNTKAYVKNILMGSLALVFDVEYIYNTTVADDQSNDEIYSTMSLSYDF
jgi:putative salt-induced outer membrane protein